VRANLPDGQLTALRGDYRTAADLMAYRANPSWWYSARSRDHFRQRLWMILKRRWMLRQQQQASLTGHGAGDGDPAAAGLTVTLMLWLAAAGIGGDQPNPAR
jgi:ATP-binding cassette, subfamily C, bacterial CydC